MKINNPYYPRRRSNDATFGLFIVFQVVGV